MSKHALRQQLREKRRALSVTAQRHAAEAIVSQLQTLQASNAWQKVAIYLAFDGELSLDMYREYAWQNQCNLYLPILDPNNDGFLLFQPYTANTRMQPNKFGINEPKINYTNCIAPSELDVILTPLVGFDNNCVRFGMGGGYYDRTLAKLYTQNVRPTFVGIAHSVQEVAELTPASWDIPMDYILTEQKIFRRNAQ